MTDRPIDDRPRNAADARAARLAAALRDNLRRRKAQGREMSPASDEDTAAKP